MQMTEEEIVRKYKESQSKKGYIQILADLNDCSKEKITEILRKYNVPLPGNPNFGKKQLVSPDIPYGVISTKSDVSIIEETTNKESKKEIIMNTKITIPDTVKIVIENEINRLKKEKEEIDQKIRELQDFIKKNS